MTKIEAGGWRQASSLFMAPILHGPLATAAYLSESCWQLCHYLNTFVTKEEAGDTSNLWKRRGSTFDGCDDTPLPYFAVCMSLLLARACARAYVCVITSHIRTACVRGSSYTAYLISICLLEYSFPSLSLDTSRKWESLHAKEALRPAVFLCADAEIFAISCDALGRGGV